MKLTPSLVVLALVLLVQPGARVSAEDSVSGDFEGVYSIGATSCVVAPIRMAFEVHWKGRKEPEIYFYDSETPINGKIVFTTDPSENKGVVQRFVFDDSSLSRGQFIDGKGRKSRVSRVSGASGGKR
jgi:hypothetical protein